LTCADTELLVISDGSRVGARDVEVNGMFRDARHQQDAEQLASLVARAASRTATTADGASTPTTTPFTTRRVVRRGAACLVIRPIAGDGQRPQPAAGRAGVAAQCPAGVGQHRRGLGHRRFGEQLIDPEESGLESLVRALMAREA
jgi:hypothetical protein